MPHTTHRYTRKPLAQALLCLSLATGLLAATPALAADASASQGKQQFDIPAGSLDQALSQLGRKAGILISVNAELTQDRHSEGVNGQHTVAEALQTVLKGTGLTAAATAGGYTLKPAPAAQPVAAPTPRSSSQALPEVQVSGNSLRETAVSPVKGYVATRSSAGSKTDTPILETPQSISVIGGDELVARNVQTLTEAVGYTPGVRVGAFGYDPRFDSFSIRGYDVTYTGIYRDNMRQLSSNFAIYKEEPYSAERIEVVKGPSSVLYGQSEPSGLVNIVSKRPSFDSKHEMQVQAGNYDRRQVQFDSTGAINDDKTLAYRLTGLYRDSDSPIRGASDDRTFIAPALTWKPNDKTTLTLLSHYQKDRTVGNASYFNQDGRVLKQLPDGDPAFQNFDQEQYQVGYLLEHKLNAQWTLRQNLRVGQVNADARYTQIDAIVSDIANRSTGRLVEKLRTYALDNQAQWQGSTGAVSHTVLLGLDWTHSHNDGRMGFGPAPDLDLITRNYGSQPIDSPVLDTPYDLRMRQTGVYVQEQAKWNRWILTLGGRQDWAETSQQTSDDSAVNNDHKFSGRVGLGYLFDNGVAPYLSYSTSFLPVVGRDSAGGFFKPVTGKQVEAGIKYQPVDVNLMLTASVFQITKDNMILTTGPASQTQAGEVRSRGLELEAKASLDSGVNLIIAYTHLLPKFNGSQDDNDGNTLSGIPKNTVSLWSDYTIPAGALQGLGLGAGVRYLGSSLGDDENTFKNDKAAVFDMTAHYELSPHWRLAVNANNLADKEYTTCSQGYCYIGQPRTVIGSLRYTW